MELLIPYAAPLPSVGAQALAGLQLPHLQALLARLVQDHRDEGDAESLSPPHERALARALGLAGAAGRIPWAAWQAQRDGLDPGDLDWGLLTPVHWHLGTEQVSLLDPDGLDLTAEESQTLWRAVQPLFASQGWLTHWGAPLRWYVAHESLAGLACASLDRVIGRNVDAWLGSDPSARPVRRLQAEAQMLLHTLPLNDQRQARGLLPVNSFWLSGCGKAQTGAPAVAAPEIDTRLRTPALGGDWAAWAQAWTALDAGPLAAALRRVDSGQPLALTLCGERAFTRWQSQPAAPWTRWMRRLRAPRVSAVLEHL